MEANDSRASPFLIPRFYDISEPANTVHHQESTEPEWYEEREKDSRIFQKLVALFFYERTVRKKRTALNSEQAAASNSHVNNGVFIDEIYDIFQASTLNHHRASFTRVQADAILRLNKQEKGDSRASVYEKIKQQYEELKKLPEEGFRIVLQQIMPEFDEIGKKLEKKEPVKSLKAYVEDLAKQKNVDVGNQKEVNKNLSVAKELLFRLETMSNFISDIVSKSNVQSVVLSDWAPLVSSDPSNFKNFIVLLKGVSMKLQEITREELKPPSQRDSHALDVFKDQLKRLNEEIRNANHVAKSTFQKYLEIREQIINRYKTNFLDKDHFANISQLIHRDDVSQFVKFPKLKKDLVISWGRFFESKRLQKPKELDNFQGAQFEEIDQVVSDAIEKVRIKLNLEKPTAIGGALSELRIYHDADREQFISIGKNAIKHVAERHCASTFNPATAKEYNTKFRREMDLEQMVETVYRIIVAKKSEIFASRRDYYNVRLSLDGQEYCLGIKIEANKKIQEGDAQIVEGDRLIANGDAKIAEATLRGLDTPEGKQLSGNGNLLRKRGQATKQEGEAQVAEGMRQRKTYGAYQFAQFYPEPRNVVVFVMSSQDISHPENNRKFKELLLAFQRRYKGYYIPTTYYALTQNSDSTFIRWKLTSVDEQGWKWTQVEGEGPLQGTYTKATIVVDGSHDGGGGVIQEPSGTRKIGPKEISRAFTSLFSGSAKRVQQIRLLACHQKPGVFGEELRSALKDSQIQVQQIIGSECAVYIANRDSNLKTGVKSASKYYRVGSPNQQESILRGVEEVKWVIDVNENGEVMGAPRRVASHGSKTSSLDIAAHDDAISGPFGIKAEEVAQKIQQANRDLGEAKRQLDESWDAIEVAAEKIREEAARIFGLEKSRWLVDVQRARKEEERIFVPAWDKETLTQREIEIPQEIGVKLIAATECVKKAAEALKPYFKKNSDGSLSPNNFGGAPTTLNIGFLSLALVDALRNGGAQIPWEAKMSIYSSLTGAAIATAEDVTKLGKLIVQNGVIARSLSVVGQIFEAGNILFMVADLGWKIYELANTKNSASRVGLGIQVTFTSTALGLVLGGAIAEWAFPTLAGAAAGGGLFTVQLGGLAFGLSALGVQLENNKVGVHALRKYFIDTKKSYQSGGFTLSNDVFIPDPGAIITKLDFRNKELTFGGQQIPKSYSQGWYTPERRFHRVHGELIYDRFNLREAFGLPEKAELNTQNRDLLLPSTPHLDVSYNYVSTAISSVSLDTEEIAIEEALKDRGPFCGSNSDGTLRAGFVPRRAMNQQIISRPLTLDVLLDDEPKTLYFSPQIDPNISYKFTGGGGQTTLSGLHSGVHATLRDEEKTRSFFHLKLEVPPLLNRDKISLQNGILTVQEAAKKDIRVDIKNLRGVHRLSNGVGPMIVESWMVDLDNKNVEEQIKIEYLDFRTPRTNHLIPSDFLKDLVLKGHVADVVTVAIGPPLPQSPGAHATEQERRDYLEQVKQANEQTVYLPYDSKRQRFVPDLSIQAYKMLSLSAWENSSIPSGIQYVGRAGDDQFFFFDKKHKEFFFSRTPTTFRNPHYELGFANEKTTIESVRGYHNRAYMRQKTPLDLSNPKDEATLIHVVESDKILLVGLRELSKVQFKKLLNDLDSIRQNRGKNRVSQKDRESFFNDAKQNFRQITGLKSLPRARKYEPNPQQNADMSEWIPMQGLDENGISREVLANFAKGYVIWIDNYSIPDLQPIKSWSVAQGKENFLFYSASNRKVYFAQAGGDQSNISLSEIDTDDQPVIWFGQNENEDQIDLILEGAKDTLTVDSQGAILPITKAVYGGEFADYILPSEITSS